MLVAVLVAVLVMVVVLGETQMPGAECRGVGELGYQSRYNQGNQTSMQTFLFDNRGWQLAS